MSNPTILIVEDDRATLDGLARQLARRGMEPIRASSEAEALQHIHSGAPCLDIAVVDLRIPGGSGAELIATIRRVGFKGCGGEPTRIVGYTASDSDAPQVAEAVRRGADELIFKPTDADETVAIILGHRAGDLPEYLRTHHGVLADLEHGK